MLVSIPQVQRPQVGDEAERRDDGLGRDHHGLAVDLELGLLHGGLAAQLDRHRQATCPVDQLVRSDPEPARRLLEVFTFPSDQSLQRTAGEHGAFGLFMEFGGDPCRVAWNRQLAPDRRYILVEVLDLLGRDPTGPQVAVAPALAALDEEFVEARIAQPPSFGGRPGGDDV